MRVLATTLAAAAVALPAAVTAGPCEYTFTCVNIKDHTFPSCSPVEAAEAALVAPALQACQNIAYFFTDGGEWPQNDRAIFCNPSSPCGSLVPYLTNVRSYADVCDKFKPYYGLMKTFHGYCRDQPVAQLPGDNGLLASLKSSASKPAGSRPTPAPSRPVDAETPEPIPNSETPAPTTSATPSATTTKPSDIKADANSKTASAASVRSSMDAVAMATAVAVVQAGLLA